MSILRLNRLRSMSRDEVSFRVGVAARKHLQRAATVARRPRWDRSRLGTALTPGTLEGPVGDALARRDWIGAHRLLLDRLQARPARFVLNPGSAALLRRAIVARWPDAAFHAAARGERIIAGDYDLLGYRGLRFDVGGDVGTIDWHLDPVHGGTPPRSFWADVPYLDPRHGDHKIIWELNRHQHWLALSRARWLTGDDRYGSVIRHQLSGWLQANPPLIGVNWASMLELSYRSLSWLWAMHALLLHDDASGEPWLVDMLVGLQRQLVHVEQNLSYYFSPNTHLLGEVLALYVVGQALPELADSARWTELGRRVLISELERQVSRDGGHAERSTHYHRYTLDIYLLALLTAEQTQDDSAASVFRDAVARMAYYLHAMTSADGTIPLIGDDDGGSLWPIAGRDSKDVRDTLAVAAIALEDPGLASYGVPEEAFWLTWSTHSEVAEALWRAGTPDRSVARGKLQTAVFPDTGYVVIRDPETTGLVFDVGAHGYLNGGHAHADALAITLDVHGHPLLVDPGTATYTMNPALRDRMRSSVSHNTLTLDGASSSEPAGPFHWRTSADARLEAWRGNAGFAWAEGAHDGYPAARHRRSIVQVAGGGTLIVDEVVGRARRAAQLHWHFDPAWRVACDSRCRIRACHEDGTIAWLVRDGGSLWLVNGDETTGLGWCSPRYGLLVPTWAARVTQIGTAPPAMLTWVSSGPRAPSLVRLQHQADPAGVALAVRAVEDDVAWTTLLRPGEPAIRSTRSCAADDYQTNARVLQYATRDGALLRLSIADATHVLSLRDGLLSVSADDHVEDLSLSATGELLELYASHPLGRLNIQGSALAAIRSVRLNGRELPIAFQGRRDSLDIPTAAWPEARTLNTSTVNPREQEHEPEREPGPRNLDHGRVLCVE
jgi:uncharacterized heparinase superfamily protein